MDLIITGQAATVVRLGDMLVCNIWRIPSRARYTAGSSYAGVPEHAR
jgi:hypothetical protein